MKIILTGGGTGGHVIPNIALLPSLKKYFSDVYYIGSKTGIERSLIEPYGIPFFSINCVKFNRQKPLSALGILPALKASVKDAKKLIEELNPDVVFGKGGYVSYPVCAAAKKLGKKVCIHESDKSMGLANKMLCKKADLVMTNFDMSRRGYLPVGMPIREEIFEYKKVENARPTILFLGGSTGASLINSNVKEVAQILLKNFDIIHLCGKGKRIDFSAPNYTQIEYENNIGRLYAKADIVVSRAGATVAAELVALGKKIIFIPLENKASRKDQVDNAYYYNSKGLALVLREKDLTPDSLIRLIRVADSLPSRSAAYSSSNDRIARLLFELAKGNIK